MKIYCLLSLLIGSCSCFISYEVPLRSFRSSLCKTSLALPTVEELSSDPFMKQVSHSAALVTQLVENNTTSEDLQALLEAQLSHSDGIRGFFVTYLTHERSPTVVPDILKQAMESIDNHQELVDLSFMNLIMPTAMTTMHKDPELSEQSRKTAERGLCILKSLKELQATRELVQKEYEAISAVANNASEYEDSTKRDYWMKFFTKWGYDEIQRADIAKALRRLESNS